MLLVDLEVVDDKGLLGENDQITEFKKLPSSRLIMYQNSMDQCRHSTLAGT